MTKLITAEEARVLREKGLIDFVNNDMEKYIKHINKIVREETAKGQWNYAVFLKNHLDYPEIVSDKLLRELSEEKRNILIEHLKENGYTAMVYNHTFYLSWDLPEEKPEVKEEPKKKSLWDIVWRH